ncbi:MAG TPA: C-terminal binding protein [Bacteroides sp.]|nr:C-terminal binding protein [Bacteroides sp.]
MNKYKVVITDLGYSTYEPEKEVLNKVNAEVVLHECKSEQEIIDFTKDADVLVTRRATITKKVIDSLTKCKLISRYGVGYDNIDTEAAAKRGIPVANVPDYCMEEVSDQALALLLSCARKITFNDKKIRDGAWNITDTDPIFRIKGKSVGIIGLGRIGKVFLRKILAFEFAEILVCDPYIDKHQIEDSSGVRVVSFDYLLENADYISLHVPLTSETQHFINDRAFDRMKKSSILVNTARGPVVDQHALHNALKTGKINSAGIDVHELEPLPKDSPLFTLGNIVLSDHSAWYSEDSELELKIKMAENVANALTGREIQNIVNL